MNEKIIFNVEVTPEQHRVLEKLKKRFGQKTRIAVIRFLIAEAEKQYLNGEKND